MHFMDGFGAVRRYEGSSAGTIQDTDTIQDTGTIQDPAPSTPRRAAGKIVLDATGALTGDAALSPRDPCSHPTAQTRPTMHLVRAGTGEATG